GAVPERWAGTRALSRYRGPAKATGHPTRRLPPWARTARAKYPNNCPSPAARIEACTPAHEECLEQTGRGASRVRNCAEEYRCWYPEAAGSDYSLTRFGS